MRVRALAAGDDASVRAIFRATVVLGGALPWASPGINSYETLCVGWYLGPGRADAAVVEVEGAVVGYALVCTDERSHRRWVRRRAVAFALRVVAGLAGGRYPPPERHFYWLRLRDGWALRRTGAAPPFPAHAHINLLPGHRGGRAGRLLAAHVDDRVGMAGLPGWYGEVNAPTGSRARALERLGGEVVGRAPNNTLSSLLGRPVERLTVARPLTPPPHETVPLDAA